ncbi:MAG: fibronectin type III-like domain-contianing protein [Gammaproteobacteria bacterium]
MASSDELSSGATLTVDVPVTNTGVRRGAEVVQCYVVPLSSRVVRPPKELKAFAKVWLDPGETATVSLELDERAFAYWQPGDPDWAAIQTRLAGSVPVPAGRKMRTTKTARGIAIVLCIAIQVFSWTDGIHSSALGSGTASNQHLSAPNLSNRCRCALGPAGSNRNDSFDPSVSDRGLGPEPRRPSPRVAMKPPAPALVPPSNLTQTIRGLDAGGADAAEHGAEEARDQGQEQGREEVPRHEKTDGLPGREIGRQHAVDDLFEDQVHDSAGRITRAVWLESRTATCSKNRRASVPVSRVAKFFARNHSPVGAARWSRKGAPFDPISQSVPINDVVLAETVWTLQSAYRWNKTEIVAALRLPNGA